MCVRMYVYIITKQFGYNDIIPSFLTTLYTESKLRTDILFEGIG